MPKYYHDIEQGTDEWHALRCGVITASQVNLLLTAKTMKVANNDKVRASMYEFVAQREMNHTEQGAQGYHLTRGHLEEVLARDIYSESYYPVHECGFITRDIIGCLIGYSPDGLVNDDGLIEIKSRVQKHQAKTIINGVVPAEYMLQIQTGLMVSQRDWCDFISYSNGMPLFVKRVFPDMVIQDKIIDAVRAFDDTVKALQDEYRTQATGLVRTERVDLFPEDEITGEA